MELESPRLRSRSISDEESQEVEEADSNTNSEKSESEEPSVEIKLSRDPSAAITEYIKNDIFFKAGYSDQPLKIVGVIGRDDPNKIQMKVKNDKTGEVQVITKQNFHEFTYFKNIKIFVINHLSKVFELDHPFDVNKSARSLLDEFIKVYETGPTAIIFRGKRLNGKEVDSLKFNSDYDFEKDHLVFVQDKIKPDIFRFDMPYNLNFRQKQTKKCLMIFEKNCKVNALYLARGYYDTSNMVINTFKLYEINENPKNYTVSSKKGASKSEKCEKYNFDTFFQKKFDLSDKSDEESKIKLLHSTENVQCEDLDKCDYSEDIFSGNLKSSYKYYPFSEELTFFKDRIYFFSFEVVSSSTCKASKFQKTKNTINSLHGGSVCHLFFEKKKMESVLVGIEFRNFTVFENNI